jgi:DNA repair protein SbcC/Rad50
MTSSTTPETHTATTEQNNEVDQPQTLQELQPEPQADKPVSEKPTEKARLQNAIHGTSYKDQPTLLALQKRLQRLLSEQTAAGEDSADLVELGAVLETRLAEYDTWQQKLVQEIEQQIAAVTTAMGEGRVTEAQSQLDRSQSQLKRINAADQARLLALITPLKEELSKLLDWKKFASSEKKKELIEKMQALTTDTTAPAQKAKLIRALQDEWKTLGHSDDNDALWTEFSELGRVAFEPCKEYFKERKDKQSANLIARNNICEQLEAFAATLTENSSVNLNELTRLENQAREDWKKYAPVAQNKINALQSRFSAVLGLLRQHRRQLLVSHNGAKQALIEQARALVSQEDLAAAIQQAKHLQQQWKDLGPGSFKDDKKLWSEFRAACDALFARRDEAGREKKQQTKQVSSAAREILKNLSALLSLDDESFSESRARFNSLSAEFREALTPDLKAERKALQEQFSKLSRQYESRLRATPDKKTLQLHQQVQVRADFCAALEQQILDGSGLTESAETLEQQWQELEKISDSTLDSILKKRFKQLQQTKDAKALAALAIQQEQRARELCVEAEIMLGADTPAADKAIRMQQQLNQLQRGLGRLQPDAKEKALRLQAIELELLAIGPLVEVARSRLQQRLQSLKHKL